ncbi:MAG: hypothetical protein HY958_14870, partial [Bacteroidia bacterium]|nr:hypothetical protein [Bacteroidia bacterium]
MQSHFTFASDDTLGTQLYHSEIFLNNLDITLCELNISDFTSPVYPGTWYNGTTENNWELTIQGIGFDT